MRSFVRQLCTFAFFCAFAAVSATAAAENLIFETASARWRIGPNGASESLIDKATGRQRLISGARPFASVRKGGAWFPVTSLVRNKDLYRASFGESGVMADYRISALRSFFVIELVHLYGDGVEEARFAELNVNLTANVGGTLNVRWDNDFAVGLLGLSPRVHARPAGSGSLQASSYSEFGLHGERAALIATPPAQFLNCVKEAERRFNLPSPTINGRRAKASRDVRTSYLFTNLTEGNVEETIRWARLGGFKYILVYNTTWAASAGSYEVNRDNFPRGEASLKATVSKCHAAGLKVGLHMVTSVVSKKDPLVRPKPDPRLLKHAESFLAADVSATEENIPIVRRGVPTRAQPERRLESRVDIQIDDEIIRADSVDDTLRHTKSARGYAGTEAAEHKAGAKVHYLVQRANSYLVDLRTSLINDVADRVAGIVNRCRFDMIYFDAGELNDANGPSWFWVGRQQDEICRRIRRDVLVEGSGWTHWTWHWFSRLVCDDYAAVAPKEYLDYHKIPDSWRQFHRNFMPSNLGWWGFLDDKPDRPATLPDEVENYAVRMLAFDSPGALETTLGILQSNRRSEEMLKTLRDYEQLRLSGAVPQLVREKLREGEWHLTRDATGAALRPIEYRQQRAEFPGEIRIGNRFGKQPIKFRLKAQPNLAPTGDKRNIVLLPRSAAMELKVPDAKAAMPGALATRIRFSERASDQVVSPLIVADAPGADTEGGAPLNLLQHRALAVEIAVNAPEVSGDGSPAVLNVQLETGAGMYRDHYINLDFAGQRTVVLPEPTTERMLPEFRAHQANYPYKHAMYHFNYKDVVAVNLRWMRASQDGVRCEIRSLEALSESSTALKNPRISIGETQLTIQHEFRDGDYVELSDDGPMRIFGANGALIAEQPQVGDVPTLAPGENSVQLDYEGSGAAKLTTITMGDRVWP